MIGRVRWPRTRTTTFRDCELILKAGDASNPAPRLGIPLRDAD
jgi:hypothetical protein